MMTVAIENNGAPSIAKNWEVNLKLSNGQRLPAPLFTIPDTLRLEDSTAPSGFSTYYGTDAIYNKTASDPIPSGGEQIGYGHHTFCNSEIGPLQPRTLHGASDAGSGLQCKFPLSGLCPPVYRTHSAQV